MTRRVVLLRHAAPEVHPLLDPHDWALSAAGRVAAAALRTRIQGAAVFATSDELKAVESLRAATDSEYTVDARFGEIRRPVESINDDFRDRRRAWVAGAMDARHEGWERPDDAARRFAAGINALHGNVVVVATHGMVLTAWLQRIGIVGSGNEAADFWTRLALPDLIEVDLP